MIRNAAYMIFRYALIYHHESLVLTLLPFLYILAPALPLAFVAKPRLEL